MAACSLSARTFSRLRLGARPAGAIGSGCFGDQIGSASNSRETATTPRSLSCNNGIHRGSMPLIVLLRGINVGGHRAFSPTMLAKDLVAYDVVNVGAAGTLVVRKPGSRTKFVAELRRKLPFEAVIAFCDASDLIQLEMENPFGSEPSRPDVVPFVSVLSKGGHCKAPFPIALPEGENWLVRILGSKDRFVFGVYRRHMKTIGYLGQIDKLYGVPATTRNWNTIIAILRILKSRSG